MTHPFGDALSLDQAPPLAVPVSFFALAPLAAVAAGALLLLHGANALSSPWAPVTQALAHLGTLGFLGAVMLGALYQMTPVLGGRPVPAVRLAHLTHALLAGGVTAFVGGLARAEPLLLSSGGLAVMVAMILFAAPVGVALARSGARTATVQGMRLAVVALSVTLVLGGWLAWARSGGQWPGPRPLWVQVHLSVALLGWVGALLVSVSWQVLPMFYLAEEWRPGARRAALALLALGVALPLCALAAPPEHAGRLAALGAAPAALVAWLLHPALTLRGLARRKRGRPDGSLLFWQAGLVVALCVLPAAAAAHLLSDPRAALLFGWLAVWGWAALIAHGMLTRIVPFLVWFHRFSPLVGLTKVPAMRGLLAQRWIVLGFALHLASALTGAAAILSGVDLLARLTGLLMIGVGLVLGGSLAWTLSWRAPAAPAPA